MSTNLTPAGRYRGRLTGTMLTEAKTGTPQVCFIIELEERIDGRDPAAASGTKHIHRAITDNSIEYTVQDLERVGYPFQSFDQLNPEHPRYWSPNVDVEVKCEHETYEGKTRERWKFSGGSGTGKPMEKSSISSLNAKFGAFLRKPGSQPQPASRPKPTQQQAEPVNSEHDEVF